MGEEESAIGKGRSVNGSNAKGSKGGEGGSALGSTSGASLVSVSVWTASISSLVVALAN
jgi:hypothetical protein